ncbi:haloacid dehalogenase type II [Halorussus gelatinilyticus]|uniref:Haloacid dehalogenase type II n=1 Tax=Halorussus gelatinilyticus TaxID=2937524 RepID=A0A8U0IFY9_9EURY|nr:haloacid dehalogenase type II [Halorussus gelatinilyticus]UPV99610.1 haloacid dehalogenase type II [Halorussus gelatinilyticus]
MSHEDEALCFDMYGTLCDTSSVTAALGDHLAIADGFVADVDALWRRTQLRYAQQVALMDEYRPFAEVTERALDYALEFYDLNPPESARDEIIAAYDELDPYPDAADALAELGETHTVVVLSNGNPEMLEALAENAGLAAHLDDVVSAHEVRTFKPDPAVYRNAADRLDRSLAECRLVSSNPWDVAGAAGAGMATAWVNRTREPPEAVGGEADLTVESLSALSNSL